MNGFAIPFEMLKVGNWGLGALTTSDPGTVRYTDLKLRFLARGIALVSVFADTIIYFNATQELNTLL
jgi:hypothetical protein